MRRKRKSIQTYTEKEKEKKKQKRQKQEGMYEDDVVVERHPDSTDTSEQLLDQGMLTVV